MGFLDYDYDDVKKLFGRVLGPFCEFDVQGEEHLPPGGGYIIASNHLSFLDPILLSVCLPEQVSFGAKSELFENRVLKKLRLLVNTEQVPLKREGMTRAELTELIKLAKSRMDRGGVFGLFPEGTRSRDGKMLDFESGVVLIAAKADRPIVPVGIAYERRGLKLYVRIRFGEQLESGDRKMREFKRVLEQRVADLSGQERAHMRRLKRSSSPQAA